MLSKLAQIIEKKVEKIIEDEKTENRGLATLAVSYNGLLKTKSAQFVREQDFHLVSGGKPGSQLAQRKELDKGNLLSQVGTSQLNKASAQSVPNNTPIVANPISVVVSKDVPETDKSKGNVTRVFVNVTKVG